MSGDGFAPWDCCTCGVHERANPQSQVACVHPPPRLHPPSLLLSASTPGNEKALIESAEKGDSTTVVALLKAGTTPDCHSDGLDLWTPLHYAARNNLVDATKVLLAHDADVHARSKDQ